MDILCGMGKLSTNECYDAIIIKKALETHQRIFTGVEGMETADRFVRFAQSGIKKKLWYGRSDR